MVVVGWPLVIVSCSLLLKRSSVQRDLGSTKTKPCAARNPVAK